MNYIIVFVFQFLFNIFKTLEIKFTFENKLTPLLIERYLSLRERGITCWASSVGKKLLGEEIKKRNILID